MASYEEAYEQSLSMQRFPDTRIVLRQCVEGNDMTWHPHYVSNRGMSMMSCSDISIEQMAISFHDKLGDRKRKEKENLQNLNRRPRF